VAPTAFVERIDVLAPGDSSATGGGGVATTTGVRIIETGQSVAGAGYGEVVAVNDRTSDGYADREGEGDNSRETHDG
jgi:hypothetical protein